MGNPRAEEDQYQKAREGKERRVIQPQHLQSAKTATKRILTHDINMSGTDMQKNLENLKNTRICKKLKARTMRTKKM
eukprot:4630161-Prorocentrum_lima.AAC.1